MNITPKLNLNKHPKDCTNLSFVNAHNVKVSNDESCITSEESIKENVFIHEYLNTYYGLVITHKIVGIIACNNELVIIVKPSDTTIEADIFRYQEPINENVESMYCAYGGIGSLNRFHYNDGIIKGAFTYNVENSLIVAITEYNVADLRIPLRTINLGNSNDTTVYNDKDLPNELLSMAPEVRLPTVDGLEYVSGNAYKGWYYIFVRYKINTVDYTQWYSIGVPIYVDTIEQYQIVRYCYNRDTRFSGTTLGNIIAPSWPNDGYGAGFSDYFSNGSDIAKETFKVDLYFDLNTKYTKYQVGVVCASKSYIKAFRTSDIYLDKNYEDFWNGRMQQFMLDNKSLIEYDANAFITDNFNYFNTRNIINYKNRLNISNYTEDNANDADIPQSVIDNISVSIIQRSIADYGLVYDTAVIGLGTQGVNQYDGYSITSIPLATYLNISEETIITLSGFNFTAKTDKVGKFYLTCGNSTPGILYIEHRDYGPLGSTTVTNYGQPPYNERLYIAIPNIDGMEQTTIIIYPRDMALNGGMRYTNTNIDFNTRKKESCLIQGEVYNLFIHFTKKYGHASNGYKIENKTKWVTEDDLINEIVPIPLYVKFGQGVTKIYAAMPLDSNVAVEDFSVHSEYNINTTDIKFYESYNSFDVNPMLNNRVEESQVPVYIESFIQYFSSYADFKFLTTKWYQITYGPSSANKFQIFINNNGERLFKVPIIESFTQVWDGFPGEVEPFKEYNVHSLLRISIDGIEIPEGYDGYYISYEQFESHRRATGMLTRNDFRTQDYIDKDATQLSTANSVKSDKMFFYSSVYDVSDSIKLDYNIMRFEGMNVFKKEDIPEWDYFQRNKGFNFVHDMNKPQIDAYSDDIQKTYAIPEYKIAVADSAADNRIGLGTALQIKDAYSLFTSTPVSSLDNDNIRVYRVTLLNTTRDLYMSNNKKLVRLTDVYYRSPNNPIDFKYSTGLINSGYNGHYTYDGVPIYENAGLSFNTTTNKATRIMDNTEYYKYDVTIEKPHTYQNDVPFLAYLQFPVCTDTFFESKSFKNAPTGIIYLVKTENSHNTFAKGSMVTPANSIDLFENRQGSADQFNPKTYVNFREDLVSIEQFDKTLRRSNVIQDESRVNGWRNFPIEGYKNITENKGKIINIIGIGVVLLVHTEHSLFMFNTDNTLKTEDKEIQLAQPDVFDVSYKEVFTSDKGYGGLQDDKSYIVNEFGYIFYSNDTNRIYRFDNNQLDYIDQDILQWLLKYKPINIRIANDKNNNRLLIKFDYKINNVAKHTIISYNYNTKSFICQHGYYFDEAYSTKTNLYMQCDNDHNGCSLHCFDEKDGEYGSYDNVLSNLGVPTILDSKISIIANNNFDVVKFLEFISWKLTKYQNDVNADFTNSPVEEYIVPFAGNTIRIYNDVNNTGILDININNEADKNIFAQFNKPYWHLGVWNFSYIYNNLSNISNGVSASDMSRVFGNYFIIEFTFNNGSGNRIDFEELNYNISEN